MGWETQPLRVQRCATIPHIAPLERKAGQFAARYPSSGRGYLARWVGEPNPYAFNRGVASWFFNRCFPFNRSNPRLGQMGHVAPLGLNAAQLAARYPLWGRGHLAQRVGEPNPYEFHVPGFPASLHPCVKISLTSRRAPGAGTGSAAASGYPSVSSVLTDSAVQPGHRPAVPTHR